MIVWRCKTCWGEVQARDDEDIGPVLSPDIFVHLDTKASCPRVLDVLSSRDVEERSVGSPTGVEPT